MNNSKNVICEIIKNYKNLEESIVSQLFLSVSNHQLTTGTFREHIWKSLFEQIIPKKFVIEQGIFIIDSNGIISREVDLAVFDEQYTPYIFNYGNIRFIPIEAVAVVIQCKSRSLDIDSLKDWSDSIDNLKTDIQSIVRIANRILDYKTEVLDKKIEKPEDEKHNMTQTATRPIKILCHLNGKNNQVSNLFDIEIAANENIKGLRIMSGCKDSLNDWYMHLNHAQTGYDPWILKPQLKNKLSELKVSKSVNGEIKENTLLTLIFQLNQLLMIINNPIFFPHIAYVEMFKNHLS
jgi:hypothetical protein